MTLSRRRFTLTAVLSGAVLAASAFSASAMAQAYPGQPAPAFTGQTADGATVSLSDFAGQRVVLEWTNHDCPFVVKHYNHSSTIPSLQARASEEGYQWLQIISSAPGTQGHVEADEALALNAERGAVPSHVVLDPEGAIGRAFDARTTPHIFIISPEGEIEYAGAVDDRPSANPASLEGAHNYVAAAFDAIAAGEAISPAETRPYGCSVKYAG